MVLNENVLFILAGLAAGPLLGGLASGLDRILTARFQARIGPPLLQAFYDVAKLLGKEKMTVNIWQAFCAYCYLAAASISVVLFFLRSDLLLILFIQAVGAVFLVVGAFSSASPFSQVGAGRELLQILSYEPLLVLVVAGIYLQTGSFKVASVYAWDEPLLLKLPLLFLGLGYVLTVKLRKSPFDLAAGRHAHQELVKGLLTDYSGPYLALVEIGHWYETVLVLGLCSLFWALDAAGMVLLVTVTYILVIIVDNVTARMNWRWMFGCAWALGLTLSLVNLVWMCAR